MKKKGAGACGPGSSQFPGRSIWGEAGAWPEKGQGAAPAIRPTSNRLPTDFHERAGSTASSNPDDPVFAPPEPHFRKTSGP